MSRWQDQPRDRHETVTIRTIWLTLALSILIHVAALFVLIPHMRTDLEEAEQGEGSAPVQVQLTPPPSAASIAPPEPPRDTQASLTAPVRPPKVAPRPSPRQALTAPSTSTPPFTVPAPPPPPPTPPTPPVAVAPPPAGDLASFIAAKRAARGEATESTDEDEKERYNRSIAANLPTAATGVAGRDPRTGGGIFEIKRLAYDDAVFEFFGWNKEVRARTPQTFEVRKENNPDMCTAVIRRMILIIRDHEKGDFVWQSRRLGHDVTLSARVADTAPLEDFMLHEFPECARDARHQ
jgi:hypothetical protein